MGGYEKGARNRSAQYRYTYRIRYRSIISLSRTIYYFKGGLDLDMVSSCIIKEAFGYGCCGVGTSVFVNDLAQTPLILCANDDIKRRYLAPMINEPIMAVSFLSFCVENVDSQAYCTTEPSAGSDVAAIETRAEKKGIHCHIFSHYFTVRRRMDYQWFEKLGYEWWRCKLVFRIGSQRSQSESIDCRCIYGVCCRCWYARINARQEGDFFFAIHLFVF